MAITSRGKMWEFMNSFWMLWLFTLGIFNWISFLYIGFRAKQKKWMLYGLAYAIPFMIMMMADANESLSELGATLALLIFLISLIHGFIARKEYLLRLEALQESKGQRMAEMKEKIASQYNPNGVTVETDSGATNSSVNRQVDSSASHPVSAPKESITLPPKEVEKITPKVNDFDLLPPVQGPYANKSTESPKPQNSVKTVPSKIEEREEKAKKEEKQLLDLNQASVDELASLPGIGPILAKKAVQVRESQQGFRQLEDFAAALQLKPHIVERIRPMVTIKALSRRQGRSGRVVDY
ncbi:helix-hairpin-helix domain-containing protein [Heliorestis acidaminivorans]|uniref:Helix-hairpin-helix domain-containing protein n=1 Tax=Heliorestis acidaminivorans TaxID=553427 RepID=A0A6I0ESC4_9FIRM|nr:helix-hairpin-helix domain-containing protein [Heliorestis acidaminivorans]KAB2952685.1 helix-hairpin-helix domain-containing protein [Heliorestis acidaminivorans]